MSSPRRSELARPRRLHRQCLGADHGARHCVGGEVFHQSVSGELAAAENGHLVGESHDLAEFMRDHQDGENAAGHHVAQHAQHFVGFAGRQHRGGSSRIKNRRLR